TPAGRRARARKAAAERARTKRAATISPAPAPADASTTARLTTTPTSADSAISASPGKSKSGGGPLNALGRDIPFPVPVPDWSKPIILLLLVVAIWFAVRWRVAGVRARRLERQRASLVRDVGSMQATLVPVIPERVGDLSVSVAYRPADGPAAGGDFYDVLALRPGRVAIVLGDVAGHGRDALAQAALTRYTLRAYLQAGLEPRAALALAGSVLNEPERMRFATVVVAIHDSSSGTLTYATAGHPPPIAIGFDTPEPLTVCCSAPICCDLPTGRRQTTISLPASGQMCFFSDGLPEARTDDGLLGRDRLVEILDGLDSPVTAPRLLQRVRADALATPDDMVACVISPRVGDAAPTSTVEELEVDARTPDGAYVAAFLQACGVHAERVPPLVAGAADAVDRDGSALLRVERMPGHQAHAVLLAGLSNDAEAMAIERAAQHVEPAAAVLAPRL
ncbi:MAG: PP2C family protein-serine/threonine phosphatase, partial [Solirubrobacteraceae bacterium]